MAAGPVRYAAAAAEPSPTPTAVSKLPSSVAAAASVGSVLGALLILLLGQTPNNCCLDPPDMNIGIGLWKYRTRRRQDERTPAVPVDEVINEKVHVTEKHIDLDNVAIYVEKPERALLASDLPHTHAGWVPQVRSQHGSGRVDVYIPTPKFTPTAKNKPNSPQVTVTPPSEDSSRLGKENLPPNPIAPVIHILSPPIESATDPLAPLNPLITRKFQTNVTSVSMKVTQSPMPRLRSESFVAQHEFVMPNHGRDEPSNDIGQSQNSGVPRFMTVVTGFMPNLTDELSVEIGEPVLMLDEYRDGWCLVQRVTKPNAPQGVVPRFCLHERQTLPLAVQTTV